MIKVIFTILIFSISCNAYAFRCETFSWPWCDKENKLPIQYIAIANQTKGTMPPNTKVTLLGIIKLLKANDSLSIYSDKYNLVSRFSMPDHDLNPNLKNKNFRKQLSNLNEFLLKPEAFSNNSNLIELLKGLPNRLIEYSGEGKIEVIIFSSIEDGRLYDLLEKDFSPNDWDALLVNNTPYDTRKKSNIYNNVRFHLIHHELSNSSLERAYCRFWGLYIQQQSGELVSCQSTHVMDRINNKNIPSSKITLASSRKNGKEIIEAFNSKATTSTPITNLDPPVAITNTGSEEPILIDITVNSRTENSGQSRESQIEDQRDVLYTIDLSWEKKKVDLDLIVKSGKKKVYFGNNAEFGRHLKHKRGGYEKIELFFIPENSIVKVVNNSLESPGVVSLEVKNKTGRQVMFQKPDYFSQTSKNKRYKKMVVEYNLSDLINNKNRFKISH